ncbi:Trm112 family protein [Streptomyces capparidis]
MKLDPSFLELAACPQCHAPLRESAADEDGAPERELVCTAAGCGLAYPVRDDIPVLLIDEARRPA